MERFTISLIRDLFVSCVDSLIGRGLRADRVYRAAAEAGGGVLVQ